MESPIKNLDELLNGMLDGMLSEADLVDLKQEMAKDPSLQGRMSELIVLRRAVLSGRSTQSLRPDFASSVTLAAKKRASEMGDDAPAWLVPSRTTEQFQKSLSPRALDSVPLRRWSYAGLALAASLLFVFLAIPQAKRQGIVNVPDVVPNVIPDVGAMATSDPEYVPDDQTANQTGSTELASNPGTSNPGKSELVTSDPGTSNSVASNPERAPTESVASRLPVDNSPKLDANTDGVFGPVAPATTVANLGQRPSDIRGSRNGNAVALSQEVSDKSVANPKLYFTLVLDVSIDPQAVENRTLERILEKYDIVSTDDLIVNDEQLKHLEESKLVGNTANFEEKMGVMFLRSTAKKLDLAMVDIINRFEDFPEFAMDVTNDRSALLLVNQLGSIRVAEGISDTASRLLLAKAPGRNSPFATSARRGKPMDNASREKFKGGAVPANPVRDEISYALLLMRPAKKKL